MFSKKNLFRLLLVLITVFICVFILEAGLRIAGISPARSTWLQMHDRGYMMNQKGGNAQDAFYGERFRYQFSEYRTRGAIPADAERKVFVFGDSFAFGLYLQDEDTFMHQLNALVGENYPGEGVHFVNAGVGGTGLADWVARIETEIDELPADGILLVLNHNDFMRVLHKNLYVYKDGQLIPSQRWRQRGIKAALDNSQSYKFLQENLNLVSGMQRFFWTWYFEDLTRGFDSEKANVPIPETDDFSVDSDYLPRISKALFFRLREITEVRNIPVWVTTTGFITEDKMTVYDEAVFSRLDSLLLEVPLPYYDITPDVSEAVNGDYSAIQIPDDGHPNPAGSELISRFIFEHLAEKIISDLMETDPEE